MNPKPVKREQKLKPPDPCPHCGPNAKVQILANGREHKCDGCAGKWTPDEPMLDYEAPSIWPDPRCPQCNAGPGDDGSKGVYFVLTDGVPMGHLMRCDFCRVRWSSAIAAEKHDYVERCKKCVQPIKKCECHGKR